MINILRKTQVAHGETRNFTRAPNHEAIQPLNRRLDNRLKENKVSVVLQLKPPDNIGTLHELHLHRLFLLLWGVTHLSGLASGVLSLGWISSGPPDVSLPLCLAAFYPSC